MSTAELPESLQQLEPHIDRWRCNPVDFFIDALGIPENLVWSAMRDMADSILGHRFTAVAGCHNSSKTFTAACLAWWWVTCWSDAVVYATAAKESQIKDTFWAQLRERRQAAPYPLGGNLLALDWKDEHDRTRIAGRVARKDTGAGGATGMQGYKSQRLLMIFDEATAIDRAFWESAHGVVTFPENRWIAMANPTNPNCGFRDCFRPASGWQPIYFDALRNPNLEGATLNRETQRIDGGQVVHPYLATPQWVEEKLRLWGEGSPAWESRVRGRFPSAAIDTLISLADFEAALDREPQRTLARETFVGADIAAQGDDYSVIAVVRDDELVHCEWFHEPDTTKTGDRIVQVAKDHGLTEGRAHQVALDMGGMGKGPYDHIRRFHKWDVVGEDFGRKPAHEDLYADRRTELWVEVRDWLQTVGSLKSARPDWIQHLEADLCGCIVDPLHVKGAHTLLKLERKADMKKRIGHSPDHGDALALALAWRSRKVRLDPSKFSRPEQESIPDIRRDPAAFREQQEKAPAGFFDTPNRKQGRGYRKKRDDGGFYG